MSWAVGEDRQRRRHIGYGVPAICDHPGCGAAIDRGLDAACGGGVTEDLPNCGLFFCGRHLQYDEVEDRQGWVCQRCANDEPPFDPTPDTGEWAEHVLTDESWQQWRDEQPGWAHDMRRILDGAA